MSQRHSLELHASGDGEQVLGSEKWITAWPLVRQPGGSMKISKLAIANFRNFRALEVVLHDHAVIVGPNGVGKSNLLHALRLVLDPSLPDSARHLRSEDFWDGIPRPLALDARIEIVVELADFEDNDDQLASLAEHLVETTPMIARLTYVFRAKPGATLPFTADDFEFFVFGGDREDNRVGYDVRRRLPADVFHALRDAETDLATWRRSPLRPLLERAWSQVSETDKDRLAKGVEAASNLLTETSPLENLRKRISEALATRTDGGEPSDVSLGIGPTDPDAMVRIVRLLLDGGRRGVGEVSLGLANVVFFTLKLLELGHLVDEHERDHTFVAIEEPEAHLHPQLQRQMFRSFLRLRPHLGGGTPGALDALPTTILVTTHSPHLASIAPIKSLVVLRRVETPVPPVGQATATTVATTVAASTASISLQPDEEKDLERYIEVTRAEMLFARGVVLVEGDAEVYLVPKIATLCGTALDSLGISVCSVGGTHFKSYVILLKQLKTPFVVVTDGDPGTPSQGPDRAFKLLEVILGNAAASSIPAARRAEAAQKQGLFVGETTLEVDLLKSGREGAVCDVLRELAPSVAAEARAAGWLANPSTIDHKQLLKDIATIGKGRFAQRLASVLPSCPQGQGPGYVLSAIAFIVAAVGQ